MSNQKRARPADRRGQMLRIDIACNDPDTGVFAHEAHAISIGDIELDSYGAPRRFVLMEGGDQFRLSGKPWRYYAYKYGIGNWCWDGFWMTQADAADFVNWLRQRRLFDCTQAPERFFDWYNSDAPPMERLILGQLLAAA